MLDQDVDGAGPSALSPRIIYSRNMFSRTRIVLAALYWIFVLFVFVGLRYADPDWAEGGIPLVLVGLPWSIPVLLIAGIISRIPGVAQLVTTEAGNFFMFVLLCGGLNFAWILGPRRVMHLLRSSARLRITAVVAIVILVAGSQLIMPSIDGNALERSRPRNVPKDAVHVGGTVGWWELCSYDSNEDMNYCQIFNRGGDVIWNEVFLPYDGGKAAKGAELQVDGESRIAGPQYVCLKNGRILLPKSQFENFKTFIDRRTGKSKAP